MTEELETWVAKLSTVQTYIEGQIDSFTRIQESLSKDTERLFDSIRELSRYILALDNMITAIYKTMTPPEQTTIKDTFDLLSQSTQEIISTSSGGDNPQ